LQPPGTAFVWIAFVQNKKPIDDVKKLSNGSLKPYIFTGFTLIHIEASNVPEV